MDVETRFSLARTRCGKNRRTFLLTARKIMLATRLLRMEQGRVTAFDGTLDEFEQQERNAAQPQAEALQRSALQMRMTELIGRIATAPAREKPALEAAYEACLREYRELKQ